MATEASHLRIRGAEPCEAAALSDIAHAAKRFWGYPESLIALWRDALTVTADFIDTHDIFVAESDDGLLGFMALEPLDSTTLELLHLWIRPQSMRQNVGRRLWLQAVDLCHQKGAVRIELDADPHAEAFYARMGALRIGNTASIPTGRSLPRMRWQANPRLARPDR